MTAVVATLTGRRRQTPARAASARLDSTWKGWTGGILLFLVVAMSLFAPLLAPFKPDAIDLNILNSAPSAAHWFGTDEIGRDVLSRVIYGGRTAMTISAIAVLLGGTVAIAAGIAAGYLGGAVDQLLSRLADMQLALPAILLALVLLSFGGSSNLKLVIVISVTGWPGFFRLARSQVLAMRHHGYVEAARILGGSPVYVMRRHLVHNVMPLTAVIATLDFSRAILFEAGLSYIGLGMREPAPDWGLMIQGGQSLLATAWWIDLFPGIALVVTILGANLVGDWLADRFSIDDTRLQ